MYSLERRRERYLILYVYKIIQGIVPNFEDERFRIKTVNSERRGLSCVIPPIRTQATSRIKSTVEQSFAVRGPTLFNSIPRALRGGHLRFETFKAQLDIVLGKVADTPSTGNMKPRAGTNSLIDQFNLMKRDGSYYDL